LDTGIVFRIRHLEPIRQMAGICSVPLLLVFWGSTVKQLLSSCFFLISRIRQVSPDPD